VRRRSLAIAARAALTALALAIVALPARAEEEPEPKTDSAAPAPPAPPPPSKTPPKRKTIQEVEPQRLDIEGRVESPRSAFILEAGSSLLPDIGSLDGLLRGPWIPPIDKELLDRALIVAIETPERTAQGIKTQEKGDSP
jgi:hypothetical protein